MNSFVFFLKSFKSITSTGKVDRTHFRELTKIFVDPTDTDGRAAKYVCLKSSFQ